MPNFQLDVPSSCSAQKQPQAPDDDATPMQIDSEEENEEAVNNSDSSCCIICTESWESQGDYQACCLPCGHVFCFSCINEWIQEKRFDPKCPGCRQSYTSKDVRKLFILPVDEIRKKKNRDLEDENRYLMLRIQKLFSKQVVLRKTLNYYKQIIKSMINFQLDVPSPDDDATPMQIDVKEENEVAMNNSDSCRCIICIKPLKSEGHHQAKMHPCYTSLLSIVLIEYYECMHSTIIKSMSDFQHDVPSPDDDAMPMQIDVTEENEDAMNNLDSCCCIICIKPLKSEGHHQACSLPCGHVFGFSCIDKLIHLKGIDAKCNLCDVPYTMKYVIKLFALPAVLPDMNLKKRNKVLMDRNCERLSLIQNLLSEQDDLLRKLTHYEQVLQRMLQFGDMGGKHLPLAAKLKEDTWTR